MKKLKIAILGTRGIPNQYGGFEQFAEFLSVGLVQKGHDVTVYNPHFHNYQEKNYKGVQIIHKYSPESLIGAAANFIYDYNCLRDALKRDYDIILECGYNPAALFYYISPIHKSVLITNMDGMEWQRNKWNTITKKMIRVFEKCGALKSHALVSDNQAIADYYLKEYGKKSEMISYGSEMFEIPDKALLKEFLVKEKEYFLLIARLEPENNIETILDGYLESASKIPFLVAGNLDTSHAVYLKSKYKNPNIRFLDGIYNRDKLNNLRYYSLAYFHGHSVGGTNPSLLEAMACKCFIISHDNEFNRSVLNGNALLFNNSLTISDFIRNLANYETIRKEFIENNLQQIKTTYAWETIIDRYERHFQGLISEESSICDE